jgi:hypothetical protein
MRIARQIGLLLVTVCALSAVTVSSASAGTPLFLFHGTGGLLLASGGTSIQKLTTAAGSIECKALKLTQGTAAALRFLSVLVTVEYTQCTGPLTLPATISLVQYVIDANGSARLENNVQISVPAAACTVTLPAAKNQTLNTIKFENTPANKGILLLVGVTKITSSGTGSGCTYAEESNGTAEGTIHITADGGLLKWDLNA